MIVGVSVYWSHLAGSIAAPFIIIQASVDAESSPGDPPPKVTYSFATIKTPRRSTRQMVRYTTLLLSGLVMTN